MKDTAGREYAKLSQLKVGSTITCDGGFSCMKPWSKLLVCQDAFGLFVLCDHSNHYFHGQLTKDGSLSGIYPREVTE